MKKHLIKFIRNEDGAELIEWAIVIAIAAVIAVPVMLLAGTAKGKVEQANELIGGLDPTTGTVTTGGTSGATGTGGTSTGGVGGTTG